MEIISSLSVPVVFGVVVVMVITCPVDAGSSLGEAQFSLSIISSMFIGIWSPSICMQ